MEGTASEGEGEPTPQVEAPTMRKEYGIPVAITVTLGPGVLVEGEPVGASSQVFIAPADCMHSVIMEAVNKVQPTVRLAFYRAQTALREKEERDAQEPPVEFVA